MPRSKKRELLTFEDFKATFEEFQDSPDRAAAILSVALLDAQLYDILTAFGADDESVAEILRPDYPVGSFGARRMVCLAFGLISADEAAELRFLGKIRDEFGHKLHGLSFDVDPIVGWVHNLEVPKRVFPRARFKNRPRFMTSVAFMNLLLSWRLDAARDAKRQPASTAPIQVRPMSKDDFDRIST